VNLIPASTQDRTEPLSNSASVHRIDETVIKFNPCAPALTRQRRLPRTAMKIRDLIKMIEKDGRHRVVIEGSHRQYKHLTKVGRVTVAGHPSDDVHPKTLKSILTQAGLVKK
jgi:predicted RNA binding protein YcfA (HicA-like mRNA interferase family)